jgi:hypothetical protein
MWLATGTEQGRKRTCPASVRSLVLAALLVTATVSTVALAPSQRDAVRRR